MGYVVPSPPRFLSGVPVTNALDDYLTILSKRECNSSKLVEPKVTEKPLIEKPLNIPHRKLYLDE